MEQLTTTPFGQRPVTAALMKRAEENQARPGAAHFNKWELFRELCAARAAYGVSDRDLTVLNALLSFHQDANLGDNQNLIVFPSNVSLAERAHGMAESTLRRHLASLVGAGLIARHDSPNGKRYAARGAGGDVARAFGFDLRPLLVRAKEIAHAAAETRAAAFALKRLREEVSLLRRDAVKLAAYGREIGPERPWAAVEADLLVIHREMRRKLSRDELEVQKSQLDAVLDEIHHLLSDTEEMDGNDAINERHHSNSKPDSHDSEFSAETGKAPGSVTEPPDEPKKASVEPTLPLGLVLKACPDILDYAQDRVRYWHDLVDLAVLVRGMMGISPDAWDAAKNVMGQEVAAITVAGILQRVDDIRSPGGYLRALTRRAEVGQFSPGPMIMALLQVPTGRKS